MPQSDIFAVSRPVKRRTVVRAFNDETAYQALQSAGFGPGREAFGFNRGQFSIVDLVTAAVRITGPAAATIATWTADDPELFAAFDDLVAEVFRIQKAGAFGRNPKEVRKETASLGREPAADPFSGTMTMVDVGLLLPD